MTWDEYNKLFHKLQLNLVAFKPLMECDAEVLKLVNAAVQKERDELTVMFLEAHEGAKNTHNYWAVAANKIKERNT